MKRSIYVKSRGALLAGGAAVFATHAAAQSSVTLYGAVDDALVYVNNQTGHSNTYFRQGNLAASKFGLLGNESLGGGLSAIFDLQAGFDPNTGAAATSGLIFNREAYVGLRSDTYGTVTTGRQYTPYYLFVGPLDSANWLTGATGAHPGDIDGLDTTVRINDSVTYTSPVYAGLQASTMYALGGFAGSLSRGQTISAALRYTSGPAAFAVGYLRMDNASTGATPGFASTSTASFGTSAVNAGYVSAESVRHVAAAGTWTFGKLMLGLNYSNVRYLPGSYSLFDDTATFNTYGAIGAYQFTPEFDVTGAISYTLAAKANGIGNAARYQQYSLKEEYHLSKRTTLYVLQGWQRATGKTLNSAGGIIPAEASVGDAENGTPSGTGNQFVGMFGITTLF